MCVVVVVVVVVVCLFVFDVLVVVLPSRVNAGKTSNKNDC